jgi:hypothetical protein
VRDPHERELEEVERALSVLGGRHPDQVRAEREAAQAVLRRQKEHESMLAAERSRTRRRLFVLVLGVVVAAGIASVGYRFHAARAALDAEIEPQVARYVGLGFDALPRGTFAPQERAEVTTVAGDCYAFIATRAQEMHIERPTGAADAKSEALACTCATESIVVTTHGAPVRVLHVAGGALGGTRALAYRFRAQAPVLLGGDETCADEALAAFARDKRYGPQESNGAWLAAHPSLAADGFTTLASAPPELPFVFVEPSPAHCFIAAAPDGEITLLALEAPQGAALTLQNVAHGAGAIAWCVAKGATFIVQHSGRGRATVVSVPSRRTGGMLGLREAIARASLKAPTWARDDERGELGRDTLAASVVPDPTVMASAADAKDARVLLFSGEGFTTSDLDFRCAPGFGEPEALCVQQHGLVWRTPPPEAAVGAAFGPLPYWMGVLGDVRDPRVLDVELALLSVSRRLSALGFFPGIIEGVTEKTDSVEVLGRSGDDAIVAVGLWPAPPFAVPYTDGPLWTLDTPARVIPVSAGARISLPLPQGQGQGQGQGWKPPQAATRRTVVFRHASK